ncbi:MAG: hypothetical protein WDM85_08090 [Caulobacteraceae bacterium]
MRGVEGAGPVDCLDQAGDGLEQVEAHPVRQLRGQAEAQQTVVGPDVQKVAAVRQQGVGDAEEVVVVAAIDRDQPQEAVAHVCVAVGALPDAHELQRILAGKPHPGGH